jgi:hypothetical protein
MKTLKWTKFFAVAGAVTGGLSAANHNITYPTEILGYGLPYFILFTLIGLLIDGIASMLAKRNK